jgi:alpha-D-xyloside xylohydrolase
MQADWADRMEKYVNVTGKSPVYPEWTTGFWQSKNRYINQSEVLAVAEAHLSHGLPISCLVIDYFNWAGPGPERFGSTPLGNDNLPEQCWPDPAGMVCGCASAARRSLCRGSEVSAGAAAQVDGD